MNKIIHNFSTWQVISDGSWLIEKGIKQFDPISTTVGTEFHKSGYRHQSLTPIC
jgi:hypothetical protein